ncbi:hypothetical protein BKP45_08590 [Anaerobacillus alkalidiazotrophicus]|uniref:Uncharacterized protein n=1 Tax=Anaerobacillus alkalidiazotrophicus TaxID=472963 RepID=A0A1S2M7M9_9BACI|nr:hypothetical protein [Anaerobacillus alkalidiazotrophicus]OIJ20691.1 hypothetical protein BKP45_08590 [Anaerobacillus alkalidiazotrophicus]
MIRQYLWVKWGEILIGNLIVITIVTLIAFCVGKLLNITIRYNPLILGAIGSCLFIEYKNYRKWLRNGATF